jgi:hypothetical protein
MPIREKTMTTAEALRSIREDWLHYIQTPIWRDEGFTEKGERNGLKADDTPSSPRIGPS